MATQFRPEPTGAITGPADFRDTFSGDLALSEFLLEQVGFRGTEDLTERVTTGSLERTIDGASTLTVTIADFDGQVLGSNIFGYSARGESSTYVDLAREQAGYDRLAGIDVELDGLHFRLVKITTGNDGALTLVFEDRMVALMRGVKQYRHALRAHKTRIQFMEKLVDDVNRIKQADIRVRAPDEDVRQNVHAYRTRNKTVLHQNRFERSNTRQPGLGRNVVLRIPRARSTTGIATARQRDMAEVIVAVGLKLKAPVRVIQCAMMVAMEEDSLNNTSGGDRDSGGLYQQRPSMGWGSRAQVTNPAFATQSFMAGIGGNKGALYYNGASKGTASIIDIAKKVQRSGYTGLWEPYLADAVHNVAAILGAGGKGMKLGRDGLLAGGSIDITTTKVTPYQFTQGEPGKPEDVWTALKRLGDEVGDRVFPVRNDLWIASDETLMRQRPRIHLGPDDDAVISRPAGDMDRGQAAHEITLDLDFRRWEIPPGSVVELADDYGPFAGRWIVHDVQRSLFAQQGTADLQRPERQRVEPAPTTSTTTTTKSFRGVTGRLGRLPASIRAQGVNDSSAKYPEAIVRMWAEAVRIHNAAYPYTWGGGHGGFAGPYDCSGAVSAVLHAGGLLSSPETSGSLASWGRAGGGKYFTVYANGAHVFMVFHINGKLIHFGTGHTRPGGGAGFQSYLHSTVGFAHRKYPGL